jgi:hypothetical protein
MEHVARTHGDVPKQLAERTVANPLEVFTPRCCAIPAEDDRSTGSRFQDVPALGFTDRLMLDAGGVGVVRMDLHGERVPRIDELRQDGKDAAGISAAGEAPPVRRADVRERHARKRAARDPIGIPAFPRFADRRLGRRVFTVAFDERVAAPDRFFL